MSNKNPLIENTGIADFPNVNAEHIAPAVEFLLKEFDSKLEAIENNTESATWSNVIVPLEDISELIHRVWAPVSHLSMVRSEDALRAEYEKAQPSIVSLSLKMGQSQKLYKKLTALREGADWVSYSNAQKRTIEENLMNQKLSGIALEGEVQTRFNEIQKNFLHYRLSFQIMF